MLISGKLVLDYCLFASNSTPSKPQFAIIVAELERALPDYLISYGEVQQLFVPITKEQFESNHNLGRVVSLIEGVGYSIVKKMTISVALPDADRSYMDCCTVLGMVWEDIRDNASEGVPITSRIVITTFVSQEIAV